MAYSTDPYDQRIAANRIKLLFLRVRRRKVGTVKLFICSFDAATTRHAALRRQAGFAFVESLAHAATLGELRDELKEGLVRYGSGSAEFEGLALRALGDEGTESDSYARAELLEYYVKAVLTQTSFMALLERKGMTSLQSARHAIGGGRCGSFGLYIGAFRDGFLEAHPKFKVKGGYSMPGFVEAFTRWMRETYPDVRSKADAQKVWDVATAYTPREPIDIWTEGDDKDLWNLVEGQDDADIDWEAIAERLDTNRSASFLEWRWRETKRAAAEWEAGRRVTVFIDPNFTGGAGSYFSGDYYRLPPELSRQGNARFIYRSASGRTYLFKHTFTRGEDHIFESWVLSTSINTTSAYVCLSDPTASQSPIGLTRFYVPTDDGSKLVPVSVSVTSAPAVVTPEPAVEAPPVAEAPPVEAPPVVEDPPAEAPPAPATTTNDDTDDEVPPEPPLPEDDDDDDAAMPPPPPQDDDDEAPPPPPPQHDEEDDAPLPPPQQQQQQPAPTPAPAPQMDATMAAAAAAAATAAALEATGRGRVRARESPDDTNPRPSRRPRHDDRTVVGSLFVLVVLALFCNCSQWLMN
jgi:hypothetical protein